ncbi:terpenoid synthase [Aspergillus stella-maris]|uniref:terpenoid synthase n=1 Tax=Aspergillus stella-maris TaxID=1810926 RepID=UPI003CCE1BD6
MRAFKDEYRDLLTQFMRDISFRKHECGPFAYVERAILEYFRAHNFSPEFIRRGYPAIKASCAIATTTYPFVSVETQEVIAIYTSFAILIDDTTNVSTDDLQSFLARLCGGQSQPNPLLRDMLRFIADVIPQHYGPFASDMIRKSIIEFISACVIENNYTGKIKLAKTAPDFPYFLRHKTGMAEAYAFFTFPEELFPENTFLPVYFPVIPDLVKYLNLANDLLSFYKESIVGRETFNYISNHANTHKLRPADSLRDTVLSLTICVSNTKETLASPENGGLRDAVTKVFNGYVIYHSSSARYRLAELAIPDLDTARVSTEGPADVGVYINGES